MLFPNSYLQESLLAMNFYRMKPIAHQQEP